MAIRLAEHYRSNQALPADTRDRRTNCSCIKHRVAQQGSRNLGRLGPRGPGGPAGVPARAARSTQARPRSDRARARELRASPRPEDLSRARRAGLQPRPLRSGPRGSSGSVRGPSGLGPGAVGSTPRTALRQQARPAVAIEERSGARDRRHPGRSQVPGLHGEHSGQTLIS